MFEYSTLLRILRGGTSIKSNAGPFGDKKFEKKLNSAEKNWKGDTLVSSGFVLRLKSKK